ncbi:hypothetical protein EIL87_20365 [Saccharopolyspora rhizosphaerae]|uniref:Nitroreductase domain-containing protein n=1 Tax=Saccharopolyspora rhizosphaerae TaxID=2492662 RepID=A0A3R8QK07_9PSEU|nr:hypothetical protein [Saccharopolyspora rhizosphaerae]RRO14115.1 hypothetical protein EIL87_20365 [Saccharopolyspora rhizosphaerae]
MTDVGIDAGGVRAACSLADCVPSLLAAKPWRWNHHGDSLQLRLDTSPELPESDPAARASVIACGAALHHAALALRAQGSRIQVDRLPLPEDPSLLGQIRILGTRDPVPADRALARAARRRHLDKRSFAPMPVPPGLLVDVESVSDAADITVITGEQQCALSRAFTMAAMIHAATEASRAELIGARLTERDTPESAGSLLLISTPTDDREAHLRAGEALGAVLCWAELAGLAAWPCNEAFEVPRTRAAAKREVLGDAAHPQLVVRLGWPAARG